MIEPIYIIEDLPYTKEFKGGTIYILGIHTGEPIEQEIYHRKIRRLNDAELLSGTHHRCPACDDTNTDYVREDGDDLWNICYDCEMAFTQAETREVFFDLCDCD